MTNTTLLSLGLGALGTVGTFLTLFPAVVAINEKPKPFTYKWFAAGAYLSVGPAALLGSGLTTLTQNNKFLALYAIPVAGIVALQIWDYIQTPKNSDDINGNFSI